MRPAPGFERASRPRRASLVRRGLLIGAALVVGACGGHGATNAAATSRSVGTASASATASRTAGTSTAVISRAAASADWPDFGYTADRSGVGPTDTGITAANVSRLKLRQVTIDGIADSSAIELHAVKVNGTSHDLVAVTTSYGNTVAFDARTGRRLWEYRPRGVNASLGNPQVTTASPVADPDRQFLYSASPDGVIHKLAVANGHQVWSRSITFDPKHEKIASALNVTTGSVVAATGGYIGDIPPYDGHVVTISRRTGRIVHVWNSECSNRHKLIAASSCPVTNTNGDNAIWGRAGAVIEAGSRRILVATGNGPFDGRTSWGSSALELTPDASRLLHNWTPPNQDQLSRSGHRRRLHLTGDPARLPRLPAGRAGRQGRPAAPAQPGAAGRHHGPPPVRGSAASWARSAHRAAVR